MDTINTNEIIKKIEEINQNINEKNINSASKEDLIEYLKLVDQLKAMLLMASEK